MKAVFADSYYYLAFVNERDAGYEAAIEYSRTYVGRSVTTEWVLMEVADALSDPWQRPIFLELMNRLRSEPGVLIVAASHDLFDRGIALFSERPDKSWSLTDCISFVVMQDHGLTEALTADHHFEQAGFVRLLK
jgi:predicted nucleic acid-binding protein